MKSVTKVLRQLFGSVDSRTKNSYLTWAKIEYGNDWQFAYDHMLRTNGQKLPKANENLRGWI